MDIADTFFKQFEILADAPNAVPKLRELILQLAVRGKLVSQDPNDEPASVLLEKILEEKLQLIKNGSLPKSAMLPSLVDDNTSSFQVPKNWLWVTLGGVMTKLTDGTHNSPPNSSSGDYKYITAKNIKAEGIDLKNITYIPKDIHEEIYARCNPEFGDILYIKDGATTGIVTINNLSEEFSLLSSVALLKPSKYIYNYYVLYALRSPYFYSTVREDMSGVAITRVTLTKLNRTLFPLPPLNEQKRIVEKVDKLMEWCDRLEKQQQQRRETCINLNRVALTQLTTAKTTDEFSDRWQKVHDNFDLLYSLPENVSQLRQTILQLAVMGKLVKQDPNDEPVSILKTKLQIERETLLKHGEIKKAEIFKANIDNQKFIIPSTWQWSTLSELFMVITDGEHQAPPKQSSGIPFLVISDVREGLLDFTSTRFVSEDYFNKLDKNRKPSKGDILYTVVGSYGIPIIVDTDKPFFVQRHIAILKPSNNLDTYFLKYSLLSSLVFDQATECATGIAQKTVTLGGLRKITIPLPPLNEQKRIVAKVEEMMRLCDGLEAKLKDTETNQQKLLESGIRQVLSQI